MNLTQSYLIYSSHESGNRRLEVKHGITWVTKRYAWHWAKVDPAPIHRTVELRQIWERNVKSTVWISIIQKRAIGFMLEHNVLEKW